MSISLIIEHLYIVLAASVLAIVIGIPLGIAAYLFPKSRTVILRIVDIFQTIPALALLGMIMLLAGPGKVTVIIGITLYSLLPIVQNTYVGLSNVDPGVREAAIGVGMTNRDRILNVEFPIAFPTIFTGIRIAIVNAIGTAVFAAFVGGGGIGGIMNRAIRVQNMPMILAATGALMIIAVILDLLMSFSESRIRKSHSNMKRVVSSLLVIVIAFAATVPFVAGKSAVKNELVLYDGDYSETQLMYRMTKYLIEDGSDVNVTIKDQMSQVNNFKSLIGDRHSCDLMISYDGTLLTTFMKLDPKDVPEGMDMYDFVNKKAVQDYEIEMIGKLGFNNTYAIAVPKDIADQYGLEKVSDLQAVAGELVFGAEHEFFTQEGSMKYGPFTEFYGLNFKEAKSVDVSLKYSAVEKGEYQVTEVYATDGLNVKAGLVILEDDRHFFPEYNGAFVVRKDTYTRFKESAPNLKEILQQLNGRISTEKMAELTFEVDVNGRSADEVAYEFLKSENLVG